MARTLKDSCQEEKNKEEEEEVKKKKEFESVKMEVRVDWYFLAMKREKKRNLPLIHPQIHLSLLMQMCAFTRQDFVPKKERKRRPTSWDLKGTCICVCVYVVMLVYVSVCMM